MSTEVLYHEKPELPGKKFFTCQSGLGVMSTDFCADSHKKSKTKEFIDWNKREVCRFCPVGSLHAGDRKVVSCSRFFGSRFCARCERMTNRLVGGSLCVSCYNRERENAEGKNAKGNPLKLIRHYRDVHLLVIQGDVAKPVVSKNTISTSEAVLSVLLKSESGVMFGWAGTGVQKT